MCFPVLMLEWRSCLREGRRRQSFSPFWALLAVNVGIRSLGGHKVMVVYYCIAKGSERLFVFEKGGWNHEHCDFCGKSVPVGETCWTTPDSNFVVFCEECYEKLKVK